MLDPLVRLHGIDENRAGEVAELLAYFRSLQRELGLSVLLVHHTRKNAGDGVAAGQGLRGSGDIHAFGDSNLYLRRTEQHLILSSEHRSAPASSPVYLELVVTDAETTHLEVIAEPDARTGADSKSKCSSFWLKATCSRERGCVIHWRSRTSDWARCWSRSSGLVRSAARLAGWQGFR